MSKQDNKIKDISEISKEYVASDSTTVLPGLGQMCAKVKSQKKISVSDVEIIQTMEKFYDIFRYFNSLDEYSTFVFNNANINDVKLPKEFEDFIIPAAVRFDPTDLRSKNLVLKDKEMAAPMSYLEYVNLCDTFRGYFKKDASNDMVSLTDLKKSQTLSSIIDRASNVVNDEYSVNYGTQVYYPIRLQNITLLYEDRHFNATESDLMSDYLSNFRF